MTVTIYAQDNEFAASSGSNIDVTANYSFFDHPPNSTKNLTVTSNAGDGDPTRFDVGETYDLTWTGHGGGIMEDAVIIRSDYLGPGEGVIVFEGTNSVNGEAFQMVWTPGFDLEEWYRDNGGGPSSPNAFWTSDQNNAQTVDYPCYAPGTRVMTATGEVMVEDLAAGDRVATVDHGPQAIRWARSGLQALDGVEPGGKPVLISAGALGTDRPAANLIVSPQHRILVGGHRQLQDRFRAEAFVPAKSLTTLPGIRHMNGRQQIVWVHFACDRHEVVFANGCVSESLLLGRMVVNGLTGPERRALGRLFPAAPADGGALNGPPARLCLSVGAVRRRLAQGNDRDRRKAVAAIRKTEADLPPERHLAGLHRDVGTPGFNAAEPFHAS